ncbi:MAG: hypothetical protein JWP01_2684 [Myxococcales bacterium]|nr:hypothetical protein [Myxococcales bacterium]
MKYATGCVVALALLGTAACSDDSMTTPDATVSDAAIPDAPPREVITSMPGLVPTELVEGIMTGGPGDLAVIKLTAMLPDLGWNIHGHANGGTQIAYEEHGKAMVEYVFSPTSESDWYLLVRNEGTANLEVQIRVEIYGDMTWRWQ